MKKGFMIVNMEYMRRWRDRLDRLLSSGTIHPDSSNFAVVDGVKHQIDCVLSMNACILPVDMWPGVTKMDVMKELGVSFTFDYALPHQWVQSVMKELGVDPVPHFVWDCDTNSPFPITETGKIIHRIYDHVMVKI